MKDTPCLSIAGFAGDSGKTILSLGLAAHWKAQGKRVQPFKKGPDYIDAAWLGLAAGRSCRNLDVFLMGASVVRETWRRWSSQCDLSLIEGNRGVFDGIDSRGSNSTAELAKLLECPVLLVLDVTKMTRTSAAMIKGVQALDPGLNLVGVVINRVAGRRHQRVVTDAIEESTDLPVLGAIPKLGNDTFIPGRHLGLVTTDEHPGVQKALNTARSVVEEYLDIEELEKLLGISSAESNQAVRESLERGQQEKEPNGKVVIGVLRDAAFPFYYPENLELLQESGAEIHTVSVLADEKLPAGLDALYIGGGFPETHAAQIASNSSFLRSLKEAASAGLPIYAECGGLMLLTKSITFRESTYPMAGIFPLEVAWGENRRGMGTQGESSRQIHRFIEKVKRF